MDATRFDALTIALAHRRAILRSLLASVSAGLLADTPAAAGPVPPCLPPDTTCTKSADCCSSKCKKKRGKRKGRCAACADGALFCNDVCCAPRELCGGGCGCITNPSTCLGPGAICPSGDCSTCCSHDGRGCGSDMCCNDSHPGDVCALDIWCSGSFAGIQVCVCNRCCLVAGQTVGFEGATCANCCSGGCLADGTTCA